MPVSDQFRTDDTATEERTPHTTPRTQCKKDNGSPPPNPWHSLPWRPPPSAFWRLLLPVACAVLLALVVRHCLGRYSAGETKATLAVRPTGRCGGVCRGVFVAMTVCPAFEVAYKEVHDVSPRCNRQAVAT